jgi:lipopolysaccharide biosynthesis glycosyltransferase
MTERHVACSADYAYVPHAAVMLHSLISNCDGVTVHLLHGPGLPGSITERLGAMFEGDSARLTLHEVPDERVAGLPLDHRFGPAMWYRIFLPEILSDIDRVLYLDVDTIIVDRVEPLWELELGDVLLAAVTNVFMEFHRHRPGELGIEPDHYFNSGVLMLNLELMRREHATENLISLISDRGAALEWPDQDALNLFVGSRRLALHPRWNCMNSFFTRPRLAAEVFGAQLLEEAVRSPAIRHFEGPAFNKPWHALHGRSGRRLYAQHRRSTPWPDYELEEETARNRARRLLVDAKELVGIRSLHA